MRLAIIGATGGTGLAVVAAGLRRGHQLTAIVRDVAKLPSKNPQLTVVAGDPLAPATLRTVLSGSDAVVTTLGHRSDSPMNLLERGADSLVAAMVATNLQRVLAVSSALLFPGNWPLGPLLRWVLRSHLRDSQAMEEVFRRTDLAWTLVRPPRLVSGRPQGRYRVEDEQLPRRGSSIDRADVAEFIWDELEQPRHLRRVVGVSR